MVILFVEEEEDIICFVKQVLESYGHEVIKAVNGEEAIYAIKNRPGIQAVITDYGMPKVDGFELVSFIRSQAQGLKLPVVLCTGGGCVGSDKGKQFSQWGVVIVQKPYNINELLTALNVAVNNMAA